MKQHTIVKDDSAVSEMVDYSIILSIILLATAIITVAGVPMLKHMQEVQHIENMEQSFEVLAMNMNKVVFGNAPSQSVELKMYGGTLSLTGDNYISIDLQVWNSSSNTTEMTSTGVYEVKNIENSYLDTSISYENTGVWAKYENGGVVMLSEPRITYANNVMVIPVTNVDGYDSLSGSGLVRVTADANSKKIYKYENVSMVNISVTSDYYAAWGRYLNETIQMPIVVEDSNNRTVNCSKNTNVDVYIIYSPMKVTID
ncbi:hypothetical protein RE474_05750 [Methanolobus sediminis]|uniref:Uncharacterized protein n=1 Tax=Methanolobus sediminis TaxID=3072978 RepID=A0AA51YK50_9EURY|nr:hypothetical protein [Methanolobus sediminis]WMW26215.1 hypothetical protein RE474_05750 [Methanolobus sediminis]